MRLADGDGADWLRAQADAQLRAKQMAASAPDTRAQKAQNLAEALGELVRTVALQQQRLQRLAMWGARQTARIVELRAELKGQWTTNHRLVLENAELRAELGKHLGGRPVKVFGTPEGEDEPRGMWGALQYNGPEAVTSLQALADANGRIHPLEATACARCGHVRVLHGVGGGCAEGPCTACDECETYVDAAQLVDSETATHRVPHSPIPGEGVNPPNAPRTGRGQKGTK